MSSLPEVVGMTMLEYGAPLQSLLFTK